MNSLSCDDDKPDGKFVDDTKIIIYRFTSDVYEFR